jgi:hypothetical protein
MISQDLVNLNYQNLSIIVVQFTNPGVQTIDLNITNHTQIVNNQASTNMRVSIQVIPPGGNQTVPAQQNQQSVQQQLNNTQSSVQSSLQSDQQSSVQNTLRHRNVNSQQR